MFCWCWCWVLAEGFSISPASRLTRLSTICMQALTQSSLVLAFSFLAVCPQLACPRRCLVGQPSNPAEGIRPEEEARSAPERYHKDKRSDDAKHPRGSAVLEASALRHLVVAVVSAALPFWAANTKLKFHGWTFCRLPTRAHWCLADRGREPA